MGIGKVIIWLVVLICLIGCVKFLILFLEYRSSKGDINLSTSTSSSTGSSLSSSFSSSSSLRSSDRTRTESQGGIDAVLIGRLGECESNLAAARSELRRYEEKAVVVKIVEKNISKNITDIQEHLLMNLRPEHPSTAAYSAGFDECKRTMLDILGLKKTKFAERASVFDTRRYIGDDFFDSHICFMKHRTNFTEYFEVGMNRFFVLYRNETHMKIGITSD